MIDPYFPPGDFAQPILNAKTPINAIIKYSAKGLMGNPNGLVSISKIIFPIYITPFKIFFKYITITSLLPCQDIFISGTIICTI